MTNLSRWHGFHLYDHGNREHLLSNLVHPLLVELVAKRLVEGFFFLHYHLGGPHVRLRLCISDDAVDVVKATVETNAAAFFAQNPSPTKLTDDEIRRMDETILANDPNERATGVVPSPSVCLRPFVPETERYGGVELLPYSIAYFSISSAHTLDFLERHANAPPTKRLPAILAHLVAEAAGFASSAHEVLDILASYINQRMGVVMERADRTFESQKEGFGRLIRAALVPNDVFATARLLGAAIRSAPTATRLRIARSQVHLSANRLGLSNAEEAYLLRMAWAATTAVLDEETSIRAQLDAAPPFGAPDAAIALREAASRTLESLVRQPRTFPQGF